MCVCVPLCVLERCTDCSLEELPQLDPTRSVVMFPSDDALLPDQLSEGELGHVIIIDSKWWV